MAGGLAAIGASLCCLAPLVLITLGISGAWMSSLTAMEPNMNCGLCPVTIKKALEKVQGVESVIVDSDRKTAKVTYDPDKASPESLTKATADSGYPSVVQK